jgi:PAS domain S-box-containing protein
LKKPTYKELEKQLLQLENEYKQLKRDADKSQNSKNQFLAFVENNPAVAYLKDETGRYIYGNPTLLDTFDTTAEEFVGTMSSDILPKEVAERLEAYDKDVRDTKTALDIPSWKISIDGTVHWWKEVKFPVPGPSGETLVGGFAIEITDFKQIETELAEKLAFEQLITEIASQLAHARPEDLEDVIDSSLKSLGLFLRQERSFLAQFSEDGNSLIFTNKWGAKGISLSSEIFNTDLAVAIPWVTQTLREGGVINAGPGLSGLPDEAKELRSVLQQQGISSGLIVPMSASGQIVGMLGLDTINKPRNYPQSMVNRLRLVADLLGTSLARGQAQEKLVKSLSTIKQLKDSIEQENVYLREEALLKYTHEGIVGESSAIHKVKAAIEQVAVSDATVLITGETGTGKELVSHAIHNYSLRKNSSMIKLNCAALPATLIEAELFGREKGAYTGALTRQAGRFELANDGTLFLDEIGDLPLELQGKLLRVLESGEFERLGGYQAQKTDARIIAATNRDLAHEVAQGRFRNDLFYRLNVFPIHVPPLRERAEDIPMLVWHFTQELSRGMGRSISTISQKTMENLKEYPWPGNVRELKNIIERALIVCRGSKLQVELGTATESLSGDPLTLDEVNQKHIIRILERTGWKIRGKHGAAKLLAINPQTLDSKMKKLGIKRPAQNSDMS